VNSDCLRAFTIAELHPDDRSFAHAAYEEMAGRYSSGSSAIYPQNILQLLGYKDEAVAASRALRNKKDVAVIFQYGNLKRLLDYYCEDLSESDLLEASARSKWSLCDAHYAIALSRLANGDRPSAREHFRKAVQTRLIALPQCDWSRSFLARMEDDAAWPPWIPVKE
jgi:hypothetical protein